MADPIFVDGVPAQIDVPGFLRFHLQQFPKLSDPGKQEIVLNAIESVYAMFAGVPRLWESSDQQVWYAKTVECYRLLTAWYIADLNPTLVSGMPMMGGIAIKRKKIDGIDITFNDVQDFKGSHRDFLHSLNSNPFGAKAYLMITTAVKRYYMRTRPIV